MKSTTEKIKLLGKMAKLTPQQIDGVLGFSLAGSTESELQDGKERMIAFVNRLQNNTLTPEDLQILTLTDEGETPCRPSR